MDIFEKKSNKKKHLAHNLEKVLDNFLQVIFSIKIPFLVGADVALFVKRLGTTHSNGGTIKLQVS